MWFYVPAAIVVVLFALWLRRTPMYRHFRRGDFVDPGQNGPGASAHGWEGPPNHPGGGGDPGPGGL